jgi:tripartite ATP-independent transporter DctP family solute receptor
MRISQVFMTWVVVTVVTAAIALTGTIARAVTLQFKAATQTAPGADMYILLAKFKELAEQRSKGDIQIDIFHSSMLGSQQQMQEQVQLGVIPVVTSASNIVDMEPKFGLFEFPFLFASRAHVFRVLDGDIGKQLSESLVKNKGVRVIAYGELGFRQITNRVRPIESPDDLRGLRIRVPSSKFRIAVFQALGAAPTSIDYKELYGALQQGVVDGQENPLGAFKEKSMWDVQKFISITNHVFTPITLLVNEQWWKGLPAAQRDLLQVAAHDAAIFERAEMVRMDEELLKDFEARGVKINHPKLDAFVKQTQPVWAQFESLVGSDMLQAAQKLR